ncbi:MAG: enoyl-CoA hydratase/isomerase family protein, partial [Planctomycetota bacterium]|nr:enoyl-CoA hydratase/isomerase family protein [Planctomycetota bacterium]
MTDTVLVERDGRIAVVIVNRPDKLNALDHDTIQALRDAIVSLSADADVGAIILTGSGEKAFIAGADIGGLSKQGVLDGKANAQHGQALTLAMEACPKPVLAAIQGWALGGGLEMALACDMRFAVAGAALGL